MLKIESDLEEEMLYGFIQNIKDSHLSRTHFPRMVIGTGLSINYGIAGMTDLMGFLERHFSKKELEDPLRIKWDEIKGGIVEFGLEKGLEGLDYSRDSIFIDEISTCTAKLIIRDLKENINNILEKDTGFKRLLRYLLDTCSTNNKVLDIMTPNYDLIIELVSDSLGIEVIDGFLGNVICSFDHLTLKNPKSKFILNSKYKYIRLFKPHGSINWISENSKIIKINDLGILEQSTNKIAIVTPGGDKYRQGLVITEYRSIREEFNNLITSNEKAPILIYGYGFNDEHFNNAIFQNPQIPLLVISKGIKEDIVEKLIENENAVVFYENEERNHLIYKGVNYNLEDALWDIDIFVKYFFS
ncbi:SIR2 family protein [Lysinibacillus endophyticus]|uniref:SIR2 family protein n=1 Tax=Ureibacillus endophyticus TaxID=1978490 RepID=UPI003136E293